ANTGSWFLTEQPYNGYDLNAVVSGDFVYFPDSLYLMITDTITGCYDLESLHIQWQDPDFIIQTTPSSCVENTGTATVVLADTTSAVNILWSTGDTTFTVSGLGIDTITVLVTDSLTGCVKTGSAIILPNTFVVYAYTGYESCNSGNGTAYVEPFPNDSTAYYTYLWNTGDTTLAINNLVSGVYYYTVTNQYGCQVYDSIVVNDLGPQYTLVPVVTDASCDTCSDGSISVTLSGTFAPPVTYAWSTGATGTSITGLVPGMYWVTATDGNNCVVSSTSVVGYTTGMVTLSNNAGIHVFPNPANELVNIVSENTIDEITLYAVDGRSVLTSQVNATTYQLSLLSFSKGVYLLKVKSGFLSKTIRLVRN
ncbi:MAG TPA: T9SS type A sorting domain-containing protein, partial [Flavobacteriales bacterium]|nr:T9SS type A sorting domain-containing protein [Flavobacteriales bacterium]